MNTAPKPLVIAHRGSSHLFPENTLLSIKDAIITGADMIELDVSLTRDGEVVVIHDAVLNRTSNGNGNVCDYTLYELKHLDAGSWKGNCFTNEKIPSLKDVLIFCNGDININIEIKKESVTDIPEGGIVERVISLVHQFNMKDRVIISSFDPRVIRQLNALDPQIRSAILYDREVWGDMLPSEIISELKCREFNCRYAEFSEERRKDAREHHIPVNIYTVNEDAAMRDLIKEGVNGIFTDRPDNLKSILSEQHPVANTA